MAYLIFSKKLEKNDFQDLLFQACY